MEPPADVDPRELAPEVRSQLRTLSKVAADRVARHLVAAGRLVDDDPQAALEQARAARAVGARVAVVREAVGETAYAAGEWAEAVAELRTARRMTGDDSALPMIADAERALGRPERALRIAQSPEVQRLAPAERAEMRIVEAGARRDLGQLNAALVTLQDFGLDQRSVRAWSARVWYAYADLLLAAGREDEARDWFLAAVGADPDGTTDADERLLELDGIQILADEDDLADEHHGAEVAAGEVSAGEVSAGEVSAGEVFAGEVSPGEVSAGEVSAGEGEFAAEDDQIRRDEGESTEKGGTPEQDDGEGGAGAGPLSAGSPAADEAGEPAPRSPALEDAAPSPGSPAVDESAPGPESPALDESAPGPGSPAVDESAPGPGSPAPAPGLPAVDESAPGPGLPAVDGSAPGPGSPAPAPGSPALEEPAPGPGLPAVDESAPGLGAPAPGDPGPVLFSDQADQSGSSS